MSNTKQINALAAAIAAALSPVLIEHFGEGAAATSGEGDAGDDAPKRGRGRPKKEEAAPAKPPKKAPKKPVEEEEEEEEEGEEEEEEGDDGLGLGEEEEDVTQEDVIAAFKTLKASKGLEKCREVLAKLGESNVLNIPAKKWPDALKEINRAASKK